MSRKKSGRRKGHRRHGQKVYCRPAGKHKLKFRDNSEAKLYRTSFKMMAIDTENHLRPYWCSSCKGVHLSTKAELGISDGEAPWD